HTSTPPFYYLSLHDALPIYISRFVTALCAALVCQAAVGQAENNNVPVDDWPDEAVELAAALPDRYSGDLSIAETIEQAIAHLPRSEEHTSELQSRFDLVFRL